MGEIREAVRARYADFATSVAGLIRVQICLDNRSTAAATRFGTSCSK